MANYVVKNSEKIFLLEFNRFEKLEIAINAEKIDFKKY